MANNNPRIVGEPFKGYVNRQIRARQELYGSGAEFNRSNSQIQYLNGRTAFARVLSSVSVESFGLRERLERIGLDWRRFATTNLAESFALYNTIGSATGNERAGVFNSGNAYGFGGTEFGLQPPPGIVSFDINHIGRGSIRRGEIQIKAYNRFQFNVIETLYMRLGFTILVEWGHSRILNPDGTIGNMGPAMGDNWWFNRDNDYTPALEVQQQIENYRRKYNGNYDALFGRITNFNWNYNPDGSYDIQISFLSLGSIVESLKVNFPLHKYRINTDPNNPEETEGNQSALGNLLYSIRKTIDDDLTNPCFREIPLDSYFTIGNDVAEKATTAAGTVGVGQSNLNPRNTLDVLTSPFEKQYFIRLGRLLQIIEEEICDRLTTNKGDLPLVRINYSEANYCNFIENMVSMDPLKCVINTLHLDRNIIDTSELNHNLRSREFPKVVNNDIYGIISRFYLNFKFVEDILKSEEPGELDLYSLLERICNGINSSFVGIVNLEPVYDEELHELKIVDQNLPLRVSDDPIKSVSEEIVVYGYGKPDTKLPYTKGNFVKNYGIESKISPELAAQISIGAAAGGKSVSEEATAFERWNAGLVDRFQNIIAANEEDRRVQRLCEDGVQNPITAGQAFVLSAQQGAIQQDVIASEPYVEFESEKEDYEEYLRHIFTLLTFANDRFYFSQGTDSIGRGKQILKRYLTALNKKDSKESQLSKGGEVIGFIPIELKLELDGISGMTIYNQIRIDSEFLPSNYPDLMDFIVTGLGHKIEGQDWVTNVTALPKATDKGTSSTRSTTNFSQDDVLS